MMFPEQFPSECFQHIFSYMELADCLRFGATSSSALIEVLPAVCVRRNRMKQRYAYTTRKHQTPCPSPTSTLLNQDAMLWIAPNPRTKIGILEDLKLKNHDMDEFTVLPTVQDHVDQLASKIPSSHPLNLSVQELCRSLRVDAEKEILASLTTSLSASTLIGALQKLASPLQLHSKILKAALFSGRDIGSTELHQYMGDVLCVAYLLFDSNKSYCFAEGTPSPFSLAEKIRQLPPSCYRSWVLMHASILRTKQFSERELSRLGVRDLVGAPDEDLAFNATMASFAAQIYSRNACAWTMPMDCYRTDKFMASEIVLVYDSFGPLGPSFRGRDIVRVRDVTAHSMLACFTSIRSEGASREALEWMCIAHEQAVKTRPMSVRTPVVRFS